MNATEIMKSLADATAALKTAKEVDKAEISKQVESTIKSVLANHPGLTPDRKIQFDEGKAFPTGKDALLKSLDVDKAMQLDNMLITAKLMGRNVRSLKGWNDFAGTNPGFMKAMDTATATEGAEWVPTELSSQLMERVRLELKVAALFPTITMPSNPYDLPVQLGRFTSYKHSEQTAATGQTKLTVHPTTGSTGKTTFTAVPHGVEILASDEVTEDSIVPILPFVQKEIITALAEGREDGILNGDTGTHEDTDTTSATSRRKMWKGLRALANDNSYVRDLATFTLSNLRLLRGDMGRYGVMPSQLAYVTGVKGFIKLLDLEQVTTVDKYGPSATVLSGELGKVDGIPVIVSEWVREDLDNAGIYSASGTKTALYLVNRNAWAMGQRKSGDVRILRELYAESAQIALLTRERVHFRDLYPVASNKTISLGRNIE